MRVELGRRKLKLLQLGEKFTQLDNWKDERFIEVFVQLYQDLVAKEEALKKIQENI
jgi:hypothetical protein